MRKSLLRAAVVTVGLALAGLTPASSASAAPAVECPSTIVCKFVPAAYQQNGSDKADYGNHSVADRPNSMKIEGATIHNTEGSLEETLEHFQNSTSYVSAPYIVDRDGTVYQTMQTKDVAWDANNWWYNTHFIGIEHVGFASQGHTVYTPAMYRASAELVKYLAQRFGFPLDRGHVIGHDNVPPPRTGVAMNGDPGPFWDWERYMKLLGAPSPQSQLDLRDRLVTVAPNWKTNFQTVTGCGPRPDVDPCVPAGGPLKSNFVPLRTEPRMDAPLITDPLFGAGTTKLWSAGRAFYGQQFAVIGMKATKTGLWYQVWFTGKKAWFFSPWAAPTAFPTKGKAVKLAPGKSEIPLFGSALPEAADYPADFPAAARRMPTPLGVTMKAGERYSVVDLSPPTGYYNDQTFDASQPYDRVYIPGSTQYVLIQFGDRQYFVRRADVIIH